MALLQMKVVLGFGMGSALLPLATQRYLKICQNLGTKSVFYAYFIFLCTAELTIKV